MSGLTVTMRAGKQIMIGDDIIITVKSIRCREAKISVDAPGDIPVHRREVYDRIKAQLESKEDSDHE